MNTVTDKNLIKLWNKKIAPSQEKIDVIYELMDDTIKFFNEIGINYHIIAGTALGQARNKGLIPWDDDVDFGVHVDDSDKIWKNREILEKKGYHIIRADNGFKLGTGEIKKNILRDIDDELLSVGPIYPFTGVIQDIFLFKEDDKAEDGTPILAYVGERARNTWPNEVIPATGWYNPQTGNFGGYEVNVLPPDELNWYLTKSFGPNWATHDGNGKKIEDLSCALHSSKF